MKKVKITVLKRTWNDDLAKQYAAPDLGPCDYHSEGEVFYSNGWQKPEGLLAEATEDGADLFVDKDLIH